MNREETLEEKRKRHIRKMLYNFCGVCHELGEKTAIDAYEDYFEKLFLDLYVNELEKRILNQNLSRT